jgi:hypothetical protein
MNRTAALLLLALAACGTPGTDVSRQPGDFALVETLLQG